MLPTTDHLAALKDDPVAFEIERNRIISGYIKSLPEHQQKRAYLMQCRIDIARATLNDEELLEWFKLEAQELAENIDDLFLSIKNRTDYTINGST